MINLWGGAVTVESWLFWARVSSRELSPDIKPQEKMRLYTIAFQYEKPLSRARRLEGERWAITPVTVQVLHLLDVGKVVVHYSLVEPDRNGQGNTLPESEIRQIEPHLASMVERAMQSTGINVEDCTFAVQCTGTNLARDRGTIGTRHDSRTI